nr:hypothetical protein [Tanacetum cinerariifolium]
MSGYGFEIVQTLIVDIEPDQHVKRSMNEINAGASSKSSAVFIPHGPGAVKDIADQIRDGLLQTESV